MKSYDRTSQNGGVLKPLGLASSAAFTYVIFYVAVSLATDKQITRDALALPAIALFLIISCIDYGVSRKQHATPQLLTVGSFVVACIVAFVMALFVG